MNNFRIVNWLFLVDFLSLTFQFQLRKTTNNRS